MPPRHLAGAPRPAADLADDPADHLVVPVQGRVQRSRLAFAVAVTLAALPIVVVDNLSATADTNVPPAGASSTEAAPSSSASSASRAPSTTAAAVTTVAPSTTAPPTTSAPSTTAAPVARAARTAATVPKAPPATAPPTTAPPATSPPTTAAPSTGAGDPNDLASWDQLAQCESGGNWSLNSGNGYYGGLQFSLATWQNVGGVGYPNQATKAEQIVRGKILQAQGGWAQWPYCAEVLGFP